MSSLKLIESWLLLGYFDVIFLPWAQSQAIFRHEKPLHGTFWGYAGIFDRIGGRQAKERDDPGTVGHSQNIHLPLLNKHPSSLLPDRILEIGNVSLYWQFKFNMLILT